MVMNNHIRDIIVGSLGVIIGSIIYFVIIPATIILNKAGEINASSLSQGIARLPDFMPKLWTVILIFSSIFILLKSLHALKTERRMEDSKHQTINLITNLKTYFSTTAIPFIALLCIMILYTILLPIAGYIITTAVCLSSSSWLFGYRKIIPLVILNVVFIFSTYTVLVRFLYVTF